MVWHAHMLNPRDYLEDCIRAGRRQFWTAGLPWKLINEAIDTNFNYKVSDACIAAWKTATKLEWDNVDDSMDKRIKCPACSEAISILWTTCGHPEDGKGARPSLVGNGYGDGDFKTTCTKCGTTINREFLEAARFVHDAKMLLAKNHPMPGTVLYYRTGMPEKQLLKFQNVSSLELGFPNRLIQNHLRSQLLELMTPGRRLSPVNMDTIRTMIEDALADQTVLKRVENVTGVATLNRYRLSKSSRIYVRKMMARYWGNSSPFALELGGAVLRQGIFTDKMYKVRTTT